MKFQKLALAFSLLLASLDSTAAASNSFVLLQGPGLSINPHSIAAGDIDGDDDQDILIAGFVPNAPSSTPILRMLRNDGNFNFSVVALNVVGDHFYALLDDIDEDGDLDILADATLYKNTGAGNFSAVALPFSLGFGPAVAGEFNKDTRRDVFTCSGGCKVFTQAANGTFSASGLSTPFTSINGDVQAVDYDRDGDLDLSLCGASDGNISKAVRIFKNDGISLSDTGLQFDGADFCASLWAEVDGDNKKDFLYSGSSIPSLKVYRYVSPTVFSEINSRVVSKYDGGLLSFDLNLDGHEDVLMNGLGNAASSALVFLGQSTGFFTPAPELLPYDFTGNYKRFVTADFNGDGSLDIYVPGASGASGNAPSKFFKSILRYSVSGEVSLSDSGLSDVSLTLNGPEPQVISSSSGGTYNFPALVSGSYTLSPAKAGCTFAPTEYTFVLGNSDIKKLNFVATCGTNGNATPTPTPKPPTPTPSPTPDITPPIVTALKTSINKRGRTKVQYLLTYSDHNGTSESVSEALTFSRNGVRLFSASTAKRIVASGTTLSFRLPRNATFARPFKFCVQATDESKNKSKRSCVSIR